MSIKDKYEVRPIQSWECKEWLLEKHYAKRIPSISWAFGLYTSGQVCGILTVGKPPSPSLCVGICGEEYEEFVFELNRLVVNEGLEKNVLSYFVGQVLKQWKDDLILVSYADSAQGHHGYIYQATNWLYTGATTPRTDIATPEGKHSRHYDRNIDYSLHRQFRSSKHRYVYFLGKRAKEFRGALKYSIEPYPKGENQRYDASYAPTTQNVLF